MQPTPPTESPARQWRLGNRVQLAIVASVGVAISVALFAVFEQVERLNLQDQFVADAGRRSDAVAHAFTEGIDVLRTLQAFYDGSVFVDRDEFDTCVQPLLSANRAVVALAWAPRVWAGERARYEAEARQAGIKDFSFKERADDGRLVAAGRRGDYVPIYYLGLATGNDALLGFDLASEPHVAAAIQRLRRHDQIALTRPVTLSGLSDSPTVVLAAAPFFSHKSDETEREEPSQHLRGYLIAALDVKTILEMGLGPLDPVGINVGLIDVTETDDGVPLAAFVNQQGVAGPMPTSPVDERLTSRVTMRIGGRRCLVECAATRQFLASHATPYARAALGVGLLLTGLLTVYVHRHLARTSTVEAIVRQRTAELTAEIAERARAEAELAEHRDHLEETVLARTGELAGANARLQREIAEHKEAEIELRRLRNLLSNIINSMPSVLVGVDLDSRVTQWNREAERLTGLPAQAALDRPLVDVFPQMASQIRPIHEALTSQQSKPPRRVIQEHHGQTRLYDMTVYPLVDNGIRGAVVRLDDVTQRVRIEEMMIQSEKMLSVGGLAAGMAHEINNPLAGILQNVQVILDRASSELPMNRQAADACGASLEAVRAYLERRQIFQMLDAIRQSGQRAAQIVSNMLSFARAGEHAFSTCDLGELLDQTVELASNDYNLKKKYDFRRIEIVRQYDPELPLVPCERAKIQQVILNVLTNGAHAMAGGTAGDEPPRFILRTARDGDMARIEIEDNGPGMSAEVRHRVFEPFFTTKGVAEGTGLGLSVAYFIVTENHRGTMSVESTPGDGATFIIRLPMRAAAPVVAAEAAD